MKIKSLSFLIFCVISLTSCIGIPEGIQPISNFELEQYLGKWYEIARLDHSFERGMQTVTATYSIREDGGVKVLNEGFLSNENNWNQAEGKAYFVNSVTALGYATDELIWVNQQSAINNPNEIPALELL